MAALSSSFIEDIITNVLAEIASKCGTGSVTYPDPEYLLLVYTGRGEVSPRLQLDASKMPGLNMQYVYGERIESGIGYQRNREQFNIAAVLRFTPATIGYEGTDVATFRKYCQASADEVLRRLRKTLHNFKPNVTDETFGESTGRGRCTRWGILPRYIGDLETEYTVLLEYAVDTELNW